MRSKPSVILIREWEAQLTGSGCCGRVGGDFLAPNGERTFRERRACMEGMAPLSRTLRETFGDAIELQVVDPRNAFLIFLLLRDFWAFRVGIVESFKTISTITIQSVVVNGRLVSRGEWPDPSDVVQVLADDVASQHSPNQVQFSTRSPDTRRNSFTLLVTSTKPRERAWPAIIMS